ncbi:MAG: putative molybdenum cofactor guanylyltransferase [Bacteroidia bacterium]|nr:MAG: putative molybdenum cofactor guanylyltransferase [Bacteroidia bacterium]
MNGIIIAGGKATRLNGMSKGLIKVNGIPIIENQKKLLEKYCQQIIIVSNDSSYDYLRNDNTVIISDLIKDIGPIGGLLSGLSFTTEEKNIVLACDMPYISDELIQDLIDYKDNADVVVPKLLENVHTLCGIYSKNVLPIIKQQIEIMDYKLKHLLNRANTFYIEYSEDMKILFTNINTFDEFHKLN